MRKYAKLIIAAFSVCASAAPAQTSERTVKILSISIDLEEERIYREAIAAAFEEANPGVDVQWDYIDNQAFKAKLPTLLQSDARPDIFFSFGGGVYQEQAEAGVLRDIGGMASDECKANHADAGLRAFSHKGELHGLPMYAASVVFWYNRRLAAEAQIDVEGIETWSDFLKAVAKAKASGITPIIAGGKDKWPLHFYYSLLALRMLGEDGVQKARDGAGGGFESEGWVEVGRAFRDLIELEPFQPGFLDASYEKAAFLFGAGEGLFHLMGNWDYNTARAASSSGDGIGDENLGLLPFPAVQGGVGDPKATFGGVNGWLVTRDASPEAVAFLCFFVNPENQMKAGEMGFWIPVAKGADSRIPNPFFAQISKALASSPHHQLFLDQALGASVGATVNDVSADLAAGAITPEEAAELIEEARLFQ